MTQELKHAMGLSDTTRVRPLYSSSRGQGQQRLGVNTALLTDISTPAYSNLSAHVPASVSDVDVCKAFVLVRQGQQ